MHSEDYLSALIRKFRDGIANSDDVGSEVFLISGAAASAGEWDYLGRVGVVCIDDIQDFGVDGGAFPEAGKEDESGSGHCG